jgi:hypothetical protein
MGFSPFRLPATPQVLGLNYYDRAIITWSTPTPSEFNQPLYILVVLAIGGGCPSKEMQSPQRMIVEYIRAYEPKRRWQARPHPIQSSLKRLAINLSASGLGARSASLRAPILLRRMELYPGTQTNRLSCFE